MKVIVTLASAAAFLVLVAATPALAQYYPQNGNSQNGYPVANGYANTVYGAYGQPQDRAAIDQCSRAAEARINADGGGRGYDGYNQQGYNQPGYNQQGYGQAYDPRYPNRAYANGSARLVSLTRVERRSNELRISGLIDSGMSGYGNYGGYANQGYNNGVTNQAYDNNNGPRGERTDPEYRRQQAYNSQDYGNQPYANQPYGFANNAASADMQFDCRINSRGQITRLRTNRSDYQRGY